MFKKFWITMFLVMSLMLVISCDEDNPAKPTPVNEFNLVTAKGDVYFTDYKTLAGEGVNATIATVFDILNDGDASDDPYIIDYRSAADFASGHIKNAVNVALGDLISKVKDGTIPKTKNILNVCYTGQNSSYATAVLNLLGYNAQSLSFGMCAVDTSINGAKKWKDAIAADEHAGDLTATVSTTTTTYTFPTLSTGKATAEEVIMDRFSASGWSKTANDVWDAKDNFFIVNYWSEAEYLNPGHIPGAFQFTPQLSLKSTEKLNLLPTNKAIAVYCYTGQTSAQVVAYLRILGYDAYSLFFGTNGFAYNAPGYTKTRYAIPAPGAYDAILVK